MAAEVRILDGGIASVELGRPQQRNALNLELLQAVNAGLGRALRDGAQAVVLRGSGGYFSAGADLKEMAEAREAGEPGRRKLRRAMAEFISLMTELRTAPVPTVALVEGGASGGGVGLLGSCQWVLATEGSTFRLPETGLGLFPYMISPVLIRRMGLAAFLRLSFEGRAVTAEEAKELGLVDEVVPQLPDVREAADRPALPAEVWPSGEEEPLETALAPWAGMDPHLLAAARTAALLVRSMSLPIAMRTAAVELEALVRKMGGAR